MVYDPSTYSKNVKRDENEAYSNSFTVDINLELVSKGLRGPECYSVEIHVRAVKVEKPD